jgi:ribosomal protein S18 acetylase RimI-like enzyme
MLVDGRRVGCCAFEPHVDFRHDLRRDGINPRREGSLYITSTGILPEFQGRGFGALLKAWELQYARRHGFTRIVTNHRKSNRAVIALNRKFGFKVLRISPGYYRDPVEATVVMQRKLGQTVRVARNVRTR